MHPTKKNRNISSRNLKGNKCGACKRADSSEAASSPLMPPPPVPTRVIAETTPTTTVGSATPPFATAADKAHSIVAAANTDLSNFGHAMNAHRQAQKQREQGFIDLKATLRSGGGRMVNLFMTFVNVVWKKIQELNQS
ncbi:hypothetical protein MPER_01330, partial [Moniliophthora perniciosa FA553]